MAANLSRRSVFVSLAGTSALRAMPAAAAASVLQAIPLDEHERVMHLAIAAARANLMHYRFYELDADDHVLTGYSVECPSDAAAMQAGRTLVRQRSALVEVWQAIRPVGRLNAAEDEESG